MAQTPDACTPTPPPSLWQRFKRFQTRTAVSLDENRLVYGLFGLTALSDARNIISWGFELTNASGENSSDRMHDWLMSPIGAAVATAESFFLIFFAVLGSYFDETDSNPFIRFLALTWPYFRDSLKALKNGYKGARSLIYVAVTFGATAIVMSNLLLPLGLGLGVAYLVNRIWYRHFCSERKKLQTMNDLLRTWSSLSLTERLNELKKNTAFKAALQKLCKNNLIQEITDDVPPEHLLPLINRQNKAAKIKGYLAGGFNGAVDGLYMYAGMYLLSTLVPLLAIVVNAFALGFVVLSILRNIYEEYCFQRKLELSAYKAEKTLLKSFDDLTEEQTDRLNLVQKKLTQLTHFTFMQALGESIRDGLGVYCALTGIIFAVSLFTPIPLFVVLGAIGSGVMGLLSCTVYHLWKTHQYHVKEKQHQVPENKLPDNTELARAAASGAKQASKQANFVLNCLQEKSDQGHYQSSPVIFILTCILAAILSLIYFFRSLAKGFGRAKEELNLPSSSSAGQFDPPPSPMSPLHVPPNSNINDAQTELSDTVSKPFSPAGSPMASPRKVTFSSSPSPSHTAAGLN